MGTVFPQGVVFIGVGRHLANPLIMMVVQLSIFQSFKPHCAGHFFTDDLVHLGVYFLGPVLEEEVQVPGYEKHIKIHLYVTSRIYYMNVCYILIYKV